MHLIECCATKMHAMRILMHLIARGINTQSIINYINRNASGKQKMELSAKGRAAREAFI